MKRIIIASALALSFTNTAFSADGPTHPVFDWSQVGALIAVVSGAAFAIYRLIKDSIGGVRADLRELRNEVAADRRAFQTEMQRLAERQSRIEGRFEAAE